MKTNILFFILVIGFVACSRQGDKDFANQILYPLEECQEIDNLDSYIDTMSIFKISLNDSTYISDISKVLLDTNGRLYILDVRGNFCILNSDGTLSEKIIRRGRAMNEYLQIDDIALSDNELMLLDGPRIKCFSLGDLNITRTIDISSNVPFDAIAPYKDGGAYLFSSFPADYNDAKKEKDCLLYCINRDGQVISENIPREDCTFSIGNITQTYNNTYYLRPQNNKHIFYRLSSAGVVPEYQIDFQDATIPDRFYYTNAKEDIGAYMISNYFKLPIYLHETHTHLFFNAAGANAAEHNFLYDKAQNKGIRWQSIMGDQTMHIVASDASFFYVILPDFIPTKNEKPGSLVKCIQNRFGSISDQNNMFVMKLKFNKL